MYYIYYLVNNHTAKFSFEPHNATYETVGIQALDCDETTARIKLRAAANNMKCLAGIDDSEAVEWYIYRSSEEDEARMALMDDEGKMIDVVDEFSVKKKLYKKLTKPYAKELAKMERRTPWQWLKDKFYFSADDVAVLFLKGIVFLVVMAPMVWLMFELKSCQEDYKKKEREQWTQSYNTYNPTTPPAEVTIESKSDYKEARIDFLMKIEEAYSTEHYKHSPAKVKARIDGDTLWLFAGHYKDYSNRYLVESDESMTDAFRICKFAKVNLSTYDAGGSPFWTIYRDK